jgi:hypothetical protein
MGRVGIGDDYLSQRIIGLKIGNAQLTFKNFPLLTLTNSH